MGFRGRRPPSFGGVTVLAARAWGSQDKFFINLRHKPPAAMSIAWRAILVAGLAAGEEATLASLTGLFQREPERAAALTCDWDRGFFFLSAH